MYTHIQILTHTADFPCFQIGRLSVYYNATLSPWPQAYNSIYLFMRDPPGCHFSWTGPDSLTRDCCCRCGWTGQRGRTRGPGTQTGDWRCRLLSFVRTCCQSCCRDHTLGTSCCPCQREPVEEHTPIRDKKRKERKNERYRDGKHWLGVKKEKKRNYRYREKENT